MKHEDIYTKFMIEYDKANVLSSYPSLTEYEVASFLDKAYNALIAQKITGNNVRRMGFETDVKAIEDLAPLIVQVTKDLYETDETLGTPYFTNWRYINLPKSECLYLISAFLQKDMTRLDGKKPYDNETTRALPIQLVSHQMALKFRSNAYNKPWIKIPVGYIENDKLYIVVDPQDIEDVVIEPKCSVIYIKKPNTFVKDLQDYNKFPSQLGVYTYFITPPEDKNNPAYDFECSDTIAEELISLAIAYALENVESARLNTKLNMRGLEA